MDDSDRFEYEVTQELWWDRIDKDAEYQAELAELYQEQKRDRLFDLYYGENK